MKFTFTAPTLPKSGVLVVGVLEDRKLTPSAQALDDRMNGGLVRAIKASRFRGKKEQTLTLLAPADSGLDRVLAVGLGKPDALDALAAQAIGGLVYAALAGTGSASAAVAVDALEGCPLEPAVVAAEMAFGAHLRSYRFDKYRTKIKPEDKPALKTLTLSLVSPLAAAARLSG